MMVQYSALGMWVTDCYCGIQVSTCAMNVERISMKEKKANLWDYWSSPWKVITTNGTIKRDGTCVMGRGCAKEAAEKYPVIPVYLGKEIKLKGNHVHILPHNLISFPVKHNWWEKADLELIERSCVQLYNLVEILDTTVVMPRPGCGNGQLRWKDVRPILEQRLDDRFTVVSFDYEG